MAKRRDWKGYGTYMTELHEFDATGESSNDHTEDDKTKRATRTIIQNRNNHSDNTGLINKAFVDDDDSERRDASDRSITSYENEKVDNGRNENHTKNNMEPDVNVDQIWKTLGVWKPYQIFQMIYIYICTIPVAYPILSWVFIGYTPPFRCKDLEGNLSDYNTGIEGNVSDFQINYDKCELTIHSTNHTPYPYFGMKPKTYDCLNGYYFDYNEGETVTMEWNLICDKAGLEELSTTMVIIGICVGGATFTGLADRFGRKTIAVYTHILLFVCNIALTFMPVFSVFATLRLFIHCG